ncbi:hypothetical protein M9435_002285 [Picochlorum sp. BPE23]|nr:hypothetical protein M9435_002285 [Picochlorum sp. BPE23]
MAKDIVSVEPEELVFKFELRRQIPVGLTMQNLTNKRVAFKVKTTNPKKYSVRPSHGFMDGRSVQEITVTMNSQREPPVSYQNCRDKFLIQSAVVGADVKSVTSELFDEAAKKNDVQQTKLRVQLVPPAQPPSPVPEETTPSVTFGADTKSVDDVVQTRTPVMAVASHTQPMQVSSQGFTLLNIILVALLAFLLGYFTKGHIPALDMMKQNITDIVMKHPVLRKMVSA